ncbi:hypothetical protein D3C80_841580 [compost metagenome]
MALQYPLLFERQAKLHPLFPQRIDTGEKRCIGADLRIMPGHFWRDLALKRLDRLVRMRTGLTPEEGGDAGKLVTGDFKRHDGIFEARRFRIVGNRVDFGLMACQSHLESRGEILVLDEIEPRQAFMPAPLDKGTVDGSVGHKGNPSAILNLLSVYRIGCRMYGSSTTKRSFTQSFHAAASFSVCGHAER